MFEELQTATKSLREIVQDLDPACLEGDDAVWLTEAFGEIERLGAAGKALAARRVDETKVWKRDGHRNAAEWLARATGESPATASRTLETARNLEGLRATADAFRAGEISERQASEIASAAAVDPNAEGALLEAAATESMKGLRNRAREVRASAEDDLAWARRLHVNRRLERWTDGEGAYRLNGAFAPDAGARLDSALEGHIDRLFKAARQAGRCEPREAYAADALLALATEGPCKPVEVKVVADAAALERGYTKEGERCEILGRGAVPATVARSLLDDTKVSLLVRNGAELDSVGRPRRTIPAHLRRQLETRYPVCAVEGCANERFLEIDHIIPVAAGGRSTPENTWRICGHHHDLKTYFGWRVTGPTYDWDLSPPDDPDPPP